MSKGPPPGKDPGPLPHVRPPDSSPGADPCSVEREVSAASIGTPPVPGERIALVLAGGDVLVLANGRQIGQLNGPDAEEVRACIERGWRFYGEVTDVAGSVATLRIYGSR